MTELEQNVLADWPEMLIAPKIRKFDDPSLLPEKSHFFMASGTVERTNGGRIWLMWAGGGDDPNAFLLLTWSDDDGKSFMSPKFIIKEGTTTHGYNKCVIEGILWTMPDGRLQLLMSYRMGQYDGRGSIWQAICSNPDAECPVWETPRRLHDGCTCFAKPILLTDGALITADSVWKGNIWLGEAFGGEKETHIWDAHLDSPRAANVYRSVDHGYTWKSQGSFVAPARECDEPQIIQRRDGSLLMSCRNRLGIVFTISTDAGKTWAEGIPASFAHPTSRIFMHRLASGRLLMVRNVPTPESLKTVKADQEMAPGRDQMTAFVSEDDGHSWIGGLLLDGRSNVSYPSGFQHSDGRIFIVYDYLRINGSLHMAVFREEDILAEKLISSNTRLGQTIWATKNGKKKC